MTLFDQILASFGADQVNVNDLPEDAPMAGLGKECESLFTDGVETLRSIVPNERVRTLGRMIWDLVHNKQVLTAIGPDVPSLGFAVLKAKEMHQAIILIPKTWPQMCMDDPFMQLGAILFAGAQAVDFYNDRLLGDPNAAHRRWCAYEAELLHTLKELSPSWQPNTYQCEAIARFPDGLDTENVVLYSYKPYTPAQGTA